MSTTRFIRKTAYFAMFFIVSFAIMLTCSSADAQNLSVEDIRDIISQIEQDNDKRREEIAQLEGDISQQKENLDEVADMLYDQKQLVDYYNNLVFYKNEEIIAVENEVSELSDEISVLEGQISLAEKGIADLEKENADNLEKFAQMLRTIYTSGGTDVFGVISGSSDFYELMVRSEVVNNIGEKNLEFMNTLKGDMDKLASDKAQLENDKKMLSERILNLDKKKQTLIEEQTELQSLVDESSNVAYTYQQDYDNYQSLIDNLEYQQDNLNYLISVSESDIENYEAQIKQIIIQQTQPDKIYQEGDWIWPVPGRSYISCYYGWDADFGRWHKGVDIGDSGIHGDSIYASKGGTVIVAEHYYIPGYSYGKYVVIDHGGGYTTTYAHCSDVYVYVGQEVSQGEVIAAVGNTGYSTGPHLHFEIRINGEPEDPFNYVSIS